MTTSNYCLIKVMFSPDLHNKKSDVHFLVHRSLASIIVFWAI